MKTVWRILGLLAVAAGAVALCGSAAGQAASVVRAVLFYSPTCPHCHDVISEDLPAIFDAHGGAASVWSFRADGSDEPVFHYVRNDRFELLLIDVSRPTGGGLYEASLRAHGVADSRRGVPQLVIGGRVLVGSAEIPEELPGLIRQHADEGGVGWPEIEGLAELVSALQREVGVAMAEPVPAGGGTEAEPVPVEAEPSGAQRTDAGVEAGLPPGGDSALTDDPALTPVAAGSLADTRLSMTARLALDPVGNGLAIVVLAGMLVTLLAVCVGRGAPAESTRPGVVVPLLALVGLIVSLYLAYVETSGATAVCGPVGDCNAVQESEYAILLGAVPIGILGVVGYGGALVAWVGSHGSSSTVAAWSAIGLFSIGVLGTAFSIYLTFLEPFVIGATCGWCLASAVAITGLMWFSAGPAREAWTRLRPGD